jgi:hypothetical protein
MADLNQLTKDDLEHLIEQKIFELLGDPDTSLGLKQEFRDELKSLTPNPNGEWYTFGIPKTVHF